jgi:hypothetical protein
MNNLTFTKKKSLNNKEVSQVETTLETLETNQSTKINVSSQKKKLENLIKEFVELYSNSPRVELSDTTVMLRCALDSIKKLES